MHKHTVSEDVEIILNGKKYLLESGDVIMVEGRLLDAIKSAGGVLKGIKDEYGDKVAKRLAEVAEKNPELTEKLKDAIKNRKENIVNSIIDKIAGKKNSKIPPEAFANYLDKWVEVTANKDPDKIVKAFDVLKQAGLLKN